MQESEIIFEEIHGNNGNLGLITLNRPRVLNALNHTMFIDLFAKLSEWADNAGIKTVLIRASAGRAFSAGGDIRDAYKKGLAHDPTLIHFFRDEYRLNKLIYHYPKPYIALLDGITMGGGAGVSINGAFRVATENVTFAMPETGIGFYPDVGASYFLSRLVGKMGFYLGLTAEKISYADCHALGIVNHVIAVAEQENLVQALAESDLDKHTESAVAAVINQFAEVVPKSKLLELLPDIDTCFAKNTVEDILSTLDYFPHAWCQQLAGQLRLKSPLSLKVTLKALQLGSKKTFDQCMQMEYGLTNQFIHGHDFYEGVRAAIIDKDQKPVWKPDKLEMITTKDVELYFQPFEEL